MVGEISPHFFYTEVKQGELPMETYVTRLEYEEHNRRKQYAKEFQLQQEQEAHMFESSFNNGLVDY